MNRAERFSMNGQPGTERLLRTTVAAGRGNAPEIFRAPTFSSVLCAGDSAGTPSTASAAPDFFVDLNLDQLIDAITAGRDEYDLRGFYSTSLTNVDAVEYRQEVMRDLAKVEVLQAVNDFAEKMRDMRTQFARSAKLYYKPQKDAGFLDAVGTYADAAAAFAAALAPTTLQSRALLAFRDYLVRYVESGAFNALRAQIRTIKGDLAALTYCVRIKGDTLQVSRYEGESDYSAEVLYTFEKFKQGAVGEYGAKFADGAEMNHIEAKIVEFVGRLYPAEFSALERFAADNTAFLDATLARFDREIQFYLAYFEYAARFKSAGLSFCFPSVTDLNKEVYADETFDLALAHKLLCAKQTVVRNAFYLTGEERILVVTGPNQGGKTTFARTFGQLHFLASLGLPVPGTRAKLFLFDRLFTHFEKEEVMDTLRGKLEDDLVRIREILRRATPKSILIMNEIFTSTTLHDAVFLSRQVMEKLAALNLLCVWVTFVDELAACGAHAVSMMSTVAPDNPAERTFKIVRKPADGLAYALAIAEKYRLTYATLKDRLLP